jgi:hypothetical protein
MHMSDEVSNRHAQGWLKRPLVCPDHISFRNVLGMEVIRASNEQRYWRACAQSYGERVQHAQIDMLWRDDFGSQWGTGFCKKKYGIHWQW